MVELYDLARDPGEERNLANSRQLTGKLEELKSWVRDLLVEMVIFENILYC